MASNAGARLGFGLAEAGSRIGEALLQANYARDNRRRNAADIAFRADKAQRDQANLDRDFALRSGAEARQRRAQDADFITQGFGAVDVPVPDINIAGGAAAGMPNVRNPSAPAGVGPIVDLMDYDPLRSGTASIQRALEELRVGNQRMLGAEEDARRFEHDAAMLGRRQAGDARLLERRTAMDREEADRRNAEAMNRAIFEANLSAQETPTFQMSGRRFPDTPEGQSAALEWQQQVAGARGGGGAFDALVMQEVGGAPAPGNDFGIDDMIGVEEEFVPAEPAPPTEAPLMAEDGREIISQEDADELMRRGIALEFIEELYQIEGR